MLIVLQGGFVFLNIVFGFEDPTCYPSPCTGIEFAHSIFSSSHLKNPSFHEKHGKVPCSWLGLWGVTISHITLVNRLSTFVRLSVKCCKTCAKLQCWVTSSGTKVGSSVVLKIGFVMGDRNLRVEALTGKVLKSREGSRAVRSLLVTLMRSSLV